MNRDKKTPNDIQDDIDVFEDWEEGHAPKKDKKTKGKVQGRDDSITDEVGTGKIKLGDKLPDDFSEDILLDEADFEAKSPRPKVGEKPVGSEKGKALDPVSDEVMNLSADVPVQLVAVIGKTTISMKELVNYQMGQVIDLGRTPGEIVDLVASGKLFAKGELVEIEGKLGVRIVKIVR